MSEEPFYVICSQPMNEKEKYQKLETKYKELVKFFDEQYGTPCEQIRHEQEIQKLKDKLATAERAIIISRKRIEYLSACIETDRHIASNEIDFFPIIEEALEKIRS